MADEAAKDGPSAPRRARRLFAWRNRLAASRRFQSASSGFLLTRGRARREGQALFDIVAGFAQSQVLMALVELRVLHRLLERQATPEDIAGEVAVPVERLRVLLQAGAALKLLEVRHGAYRTALRGAALLGVPGLEAMIRHHDVLYRDLADPVAFFRGETETELAGFWPYVFGAAAAEDPELAARYSGLMTESQALVAEETLRHVPLRDVDHLLDIGGGTGAFLRHAGRLYPGLEMTLFDLPAVVPVAEAAFDAAGMAERVRVVGGSFRDDPLPAGADAVSLVRVLYDHSDATVEALLAAVFAALPPGGRLIVSEPMSGGAAPDRVGDVYFALYCLAMRTGRVRSADEICDMVEAAGFESIESPSTDRAFVTSVVLARKPGRKD
ncbi:methyltransferase [Oceaniglobus roseus]|uniref:methyltransferase n=1 Tax=Oceaniglobus roseus TaxID=1737570 RepID=UPI000C7EE895|nr:methyltransferase [Kandeliimicrobium roseum]